MSLGLLRHRGGTGALFAYHHSLRRQSPIVLLRGFASEPKSLSLADLPASPKVDKVLQDITQLSLLEIAQLVAKLKTQLNIPQGISLGSFGGVGGGLSSSSAGSGDAKPKAEEAKAKPVQTSFDVKLEGFEVADKIKVIKEVRTITGLGLKEAKELVESAPKVIASGLSKADADAMLDKLKTAGAKITLV